MLKQVNLVYLKAEKKANKALLNIIKDLLVGIFKLKY